MKSKGYKISHPPKTADHVTPVRMNHYLPAHSRGDSGALEMVKFRHYVLVEMNSFVVLGASDLKESADQNGWKWFTPSILDGGRLIPSWDLAAIFTYEEARHLLLAFNGVIDSSEPALPPLPWEKGIGDSSEQAPAPCEPRFQVIRLDVEYKPTQMGMNYRDIYNKMLEKAKGLLSPQELRTLKQAVIAEHNGELYDDEDDQL